MVIELYTIEILSRIRATSHREVAAIPDADARYLAEAGTEKAEELNRCVTDAASRLYGRCSRFLSQSYETRKDNFSLLPDSYVYDFILSERRAVGKAEPLAEAMNTFMVEYALSKFYSIVNQGDLSNKHSLLAIDAGNQIDQLLYTKQPPIV